MNEHFRHKDIRRLLQLLRSRDLSSEEWLRLEAHASDDPFLADAIEGLKLVPSETRITHVQSILSKLNIDRRKRDPFLVTLPVIRIAASVLLLIGMFWVLNRVMFTDHDHNQAAENVTIDEGRDFSNMTYESDTTLVPMTEPMESMQETQQLPTHQSTSHISKIPDGETAKTGAGAEERSALADNTSQTPNAEEQPDIEASESDVLENARDQNDRRASRSSPTPETMSNDFFKQESAPEVKGVVLNFVGEPLGGAQIQIKGTTMHTQTDYLGNFTLDIPNQNYRNALVISHQGYPPVEADVADGDSIIVRLQEQVADGQSQITTLAQKRMSNASSPNSRALAQPLSGERSYNKYIRQNIRYPDEATNAGIRGSVVLEFDIVSDGSPQNFRIVKSLGYGCDEEAVRLIREGPKWNVNEAQVPVGRWEINF